MIKDSLLKILAWILKKEAKLVVLKYKPAIVGVTGNVGKTSTKTAVAQTLQSIKRVRTAHKNFNNELGLPVTIIGDFRETDGALFWLRVIMKGIVELIIRDKTYPEMLVLEYGVDRPGDMGYLLNIARPQVGIMTAIGEIPVHVEFFEGPMGIPKEKAKLIAQLPSTGFAILNADDPKNTFFKEQTRGHVITYGFAKGADVTIANFSAEVDTEKSSGFISFKISYGGSTIPVKIADVVGKTAAYASAAAAATALIFGMNLLEIADALRVYVNPPGRERILKGTKNTAIIDDTYNASPQATEEALMTLKNLKEGRKMAVLGDMLELGRYTMEAHRKIGRLAARAVDILITVGTRAKFIQEEALKNGLTQKTAFAFENLNDAAEKLKKMMKKGDVILIKGSQSIRMEKIVKQIMTDPLSAEKLLVRQSREWLAKPGMYD